MRIRPHDSAESCGVCHPSPRNGDFQPKPGPVANCEWRRRRQRPPAAGGGKDDKARSGADDGKAALRTPPARVAHRDKRGSFRNEPTGGLSQRMKQLPLRAPAATPNPVRAAAGRSLQDHWPHGQGGTAPAGWAGRPTPLLPSVRDCIDEQGVKTSTMERPRRVLERAACPLQAHERMKRCFKSLRRQTPQATPAPLACTSAWYEERTIGPEATWLKPSSYP